MSFITKADLLTAIRQEQLDAISRQDEALIQFGLDAAQEEMAGYMIPKYDVTTIFSKTGDQRKKILVTFGRDIAAFHIMNVANPGIDYDKKKDLYDRAIKWLEGLQAGKINPTDMALSPDPETSSEFIMGSNPKRTQHY